MFPEIKFYSGRNGCNWRKNADGVDWKYAKGAFLNVMRPIMPPWGRRDAPDGARITNTVKGTALKKQAPVLFQQELQPLNSDDWREAFN